jgi:hemerythrin
MRLPPDLQVDFDMIDSQHRDILDRLDAAAKAAAAGDLAGTRAALSALGDAVVAHFQAEEGLMAEALYPDRSRHKAAHDLFLQDFAQLGRELERGLSELVVQWIATRVPEWVKFHIQVNDAPLARFLAARSRTPAPRGRAAAKPRVS